MLDSTKIGRALCWTSIHTPGRAVTPGFRQPADLKLPVECGRNRSRLPTKYRVAGDRAVGRNTHELMGPPFFLRHKLNEFVQLHLAGDDPRRILANAIVRRHRVLGADGMRCQPYRESTVLFYAVSLGGQQVMFTAMDASFCENCRGHHTREHARIRVFDLVWGSGAP